MTRFANESAGDGDQRSDETQLNAQQFVCGPLAAAGSRTRLIKSICTMPQPTDDVGDDTAAR